MKTLATVATLLAGSLAAQIAHAEFRLTSADIGLNKPLAREFVYSGSGCVGENQSPELSWTDAPPDTRSYAISLFDEDAMNGKGFWHWFMVNIPSGTTSLSRDTGRNDGTLAPSGAVQLRNGFGVIGYSGSCPPNGERHNYTYTLYALRVGQLDVASNTAAADALSLVEAQAIGKASLTYQFAGP